MTLELLGVVLLLTGCYGLFRKKVETPVPQVPSSLPSWVKHYQAHTMEGNHALPPTFGDYTPTGVLGEGAMATVYLARTPQNQEVALKLIREEMEADPEFRQRFQREIEISQTLNHPNVVEVYRAGALQGHMYMAMEWVRGTTLEKLLSFGPLPYLEFFPLARQMVQVFHFAHKRNFLHRDIKPSNLMVTVDGKIKVLDFGLALQQGQSRFTSLGFSMGTPSHMAPEVLTTGQATIHSDQYALGIVFYQMLIGKCPFQARNPMELGLMHVTKEPPSLCKQRPEVGLELESTIRRMLAKEPEKRFPELGNVLEHLQP